MNERPATLTLRALRQLRTTVGVVLGSRRYLTAARAVRHRPRVSSEHAMRIGAAHIGVAYETYRARTAAGEKWCAGHKAWHPRAQFGMNRSAADGLSNRCRESARQQRRSTDG